MKHQWRNVPIGEILTPVSRPEGIDPLSTYSILGARWYAKGLYVKDVLPGSQIQASKLYRVEQGDFVYNRLFGWKGSFAVASEENHNCYVSNEFPCFLPKSKHADSRYLWWYFSRPSVWDEVLSLSSGGTPTSRNRLKEEKFLSMVIPLPSIEEQRSMIARIEGSQAVINEARFLRQKTTEQTEALENAYLRSVYELMAQQHGTTRLGDLITEAGYGSSQKCSAERIEGAFPVLRIPNVALERIDLDKLKFARLPTLECERLLLADGDILVVRTNGSLELVGRSAVIDRLPEPMAFASYLIRLRFNDRLILPRYAQRMLRHLRVSGKLIDFARTTAGQYNVSLGRLRSAEIPVPSLAEQGRVIAYLDEMEMKIVSLRTFQAETFVGIDALLPSIIEKVFHGDLR